MSRAAWITVVFVLVMAAGAIAVHSEFRNAQERLSVQRELSRVKLTDFVTALKQYRDRHHAWPNTLLELMHDAKLPFGANLVRGAGQYVYRKPAADADAQTLVMTSDGFHAGVHAGEPWGSEGQTATAEVPPLAYAITVGLDIVTLSPNQRDRRWRGAAATPSVSIVEPLGR